MSNRTKLSHLFRESTDASGVRLVAKTLAQTAAFWLLFLAALPVSLIAVERALEIPAFHLPHQASIGWAIFAIAGSVGISSGLTMALIGRGTPLPLDCPPRLVVAGPYRFVRNPMAMAGLTQGAAIGLALGSVLIEAYVIAGALIWNYTARPMEEADLEQRFGAPYLHYRDAVRCWLPRWTRYVPPSS
ncbi:MAG: isoprenylcysteine carboxylmethyltransferase family protein [Planctomycetes bacterium]|nr:isoprenylcysteine carboxylmethyltransferase family protein [Planctomycetota bacterium]